MYRRARQHDENAITEKRQKIAAFRKTQAQNNKLKWITKSNRVLRVVAQILLFCAVQYRFDDACRSSTFFLLLPETILIVAMEASMRV